MSNETNNITASTGFEALFGCQFMNGGSESNTSHNVVDHPKKDAMTTSTIDLPVVAYNKRDKDDTRVKSTVRTDIHIDDAQVYIIKNTNYTMPEDGIIYTYGEKKKILLPPSAYMIVPEEDRLDFIATAMTVIDGQIKARQTPSFTKDILEEYKEGMEKEKERLEKLGSGKTDMEDRIKELEEELGKKDEELSKRLSDLEGIIQALSSNK